MKRTFNLIVAVGMACVILALSRTAYADSPNPAAAQNTAVVEVTINAAGEVTVGGLSLKSMGAGSIDSTTVQMAKSLDSAHLVLQGDVVTLDVHGTPVVKMQWTPASRQAVTDLAAKYGYAVSPDVLARVEEWISSSNLDITARYTNDVSKPMTLNLPKPILVDVGYQSVLQTIQRSGIQNTLLCWDKGTLTAKADGKDLPSLTFDPKGVQFLTQALGLDLGNVEPAFSSKLGLDVSMPGGAHKTGATCGN
jgi:hypothetical protein